MKISNCWLERKRAGSVVVCVEAMSWPCCVLVLDAVLCVGRARHSVHVSGLSIPFLVHTKHWCNLGSQPVDCVLLEH